MNSLKTALIAISCSLIAVLPFLISSTKPEIKSYLPWTLSLIFILLIAGFLGDFLVNFFVRQKNNYTNFIYNHYKSTLEYQDVEGTNVSLNISIHIKRLYLMYGLMGAKNTTNDIQTDGYGKIHPEKGLGIHTSLKEQSDDMLSYSTNFSKKNVVKNNHFTSFSCICEDTFNSKEARFYSICPKHYCRSYEFVLIYPDSSKEITMSFKKGNKCEDGTCDKWVNDNETTYSTYTRFGRKVAKVIYHRISNTEVRMIEWEFN